MRIYLKGTKADCEAYDAQVTAAENYRGSTTHWANVIAHQNGLDFCIQKHNHHEPAEGLSLTEITDFTGWFPAEE